MLWSHGSRSPSPCSDTTGAEHAPSRNICDCCLTLLTTHITAHCSLTCPDTPWFCKLWSHHALILQCLQHRQLLIVINVCCVEQSVCLCHPQDILNISTTGVKQRGQQGGSLCRGRLLQLRQGQTWQDATMTGQVSGGTSSCASTNSGHNR
jgi:hypothetical protein